MNLSYTPRQKKPERSQQVLKLVRIDARTQIQVPVTMPDDIARQRFNDRYESYRKYAGQGTPDCPGTGNMPVKEEFTEYNEIPVGNIEDLTAVVEDLTIPVTE